MSVKLIELVVAAVVIVLAVMVAYKVSNCLSRHEKELLISFELAMALAVAVALAMAIVMALALMWQPHGEELTNFGFSWWRLLVAMYLAMRAALSGWLAVDWLFEDAFSVVMRKVFREDVY